MKNTLIILILFAGAFFNAFSLDRISLNEAAARRHRNDIGIRFAPGNKSPDFNKYRLQRHFVQKMSSLDYSWDTIVESDTAGLTIRMSRQFDATGKILAVKSENWDGGAWVNQDRDTYTYDASGNMTGDLYEVWWNENWANSLKYTFAYNPKGFLLSYVEQVWLSPDWINSWQMAVVLNENNLPVEMTNQSWSGGAWNNYSRYLYTYDSGGNNDSYILALWASNAWQNQERMTYTFSGTGLMMTSLREIWENSLWKSRDRFTFTYDANDNLILTLTEVMLQNQWFNSAKTENTYGSRQEWSGSVYQIWNNGLQNWRNSYQELVSYDTFLNLTQDLAQEWDTSSGAWVNSERVRYNYDASRNSTAGYYELWVNADWIPSKGYLDVYSQGTDIEFLWDLSQYHASFRSFPGGISDKSSADDMLLYPNPVTSWINIECRGENPAAVIPVWVYNSLGNLVLQHTMHQQTGRICAGQLPPGLYLLKAGTGCNQRVRTFVKE